MHVLLVEDSPINRRFIGLALSKAGIEMTSAENGRTGVAMATAGAYDAILMDMQMPIMDGFEAASRLRQLGLATPIIALTGHTTEADRDRCLEAGCTGHLPKPVDSSQLIDTLNKLVAASSPAGLAVDSEEFSPELRQIALDYLRIQEQRIREMEAALQGGDLHRLAELAHRVKGTAGTVGFPQFTLPAEHLETAAASGNLQACTEILGQIAALQTEAAVSGPESGYSP